MLSIAIASCFRFTEIAVNINISCKVISRVAVGKKILLEVDDEKTLAVSLHHESQFRLFFNVVARFFVPSRMSLAMKYLQIFLILKLVRFCPHAPASIIACWSHENVEVVRCVTLIN